MGLVEVKTAELVGPALNYAVADATADAFSTKEVPDASGADLDAMYGDKHIRGFSPSTDWAHGCPLRDKYDVGIEPGVPDGLRYAYVPGRDLDGSFGETALIALCRAIVAAKLGDVVQVPAELVGVAA